MHPLSMTGMRFAVIQSGAAWRRSRRLFLYAFADLTPVGLTLWPFYAILNMYARASAQMPYEYDFERNE
jgi:hypothetical protein